MQKVYWLGLSAVVLALLDLRPDKDALPGRFAPPGSLASRVVALAGLVCLATTVYLTVATSGFSELTDGRKTTWSPYYRIDYRPSTKFINTNLLNQQLMEPLNSPSVAPYALP